MLAIFRKNNRWRPWLISTKCYTTKTHENYLTLKKSSDLGSSSLYTYEREREHERKCIGWKKAINEKNKLTKEKKRKNRMIKYIDGFYRWQWCVKLFKIVA